MSLRTAKSNHFESILERVQKDDSYRESQMASGWTEEKCRYLDQLAKEDKFYTATTKKQRYENNWMLALSTSRDLSHRWKKREDHLEAVKAIKNLRQQDEQSNNLLILPVYQTRQRPFQERHRAERWWNWQTWSNSSSSSSSSFSGALHNVFGKHGHQGGVR